MPHIDPIVDDDVYEDYASLSQGGRPNDYYIPTGLFFPDVPTDKYFWFDLIDDMWSISEIISEQLHVNAYEKNMKRQGYSLFREFIPEGDFQKRVSDAIFSHLGHCGWPEVVEICNIPRGADPDCRTTKSILLLVTHESYEQKEKETKDTILSEAQKIVHAMNHNKHPFIREMEARYLSY